MTTPIPAPKDDGIHACCQHGGSREGTQHACCLHCRPITPYAPEQREVDLETLRADIEERYAYTQLGSGTVGGTFGEILCHELHTGNDPQPAGLHFGLIAEKWGMDLHTLGRLIADHCDRLPEFATPPAEQRDDPMHCRSCGNSEEHCFDQRQRGLVCCYGCNHRPAEQRESAREGAHADCYVKCPVCWGYGVVIDEEGEEDNCAECGGKGFARWKAAEESR